jgi:hypothetical protein
MNPIDGTSSSSAVIAAIRTLATSDASAVATARSAWVLIRQATSTVIERLRGGLQS